MENARTSKENNYGRNAMSIIVVVLFTAAMVAKYITHDFEMPVGLEIGFMTVCGWIFGGTFTNVLKEFINNKRRKR